MAHEVETMMYSGKTPWHGLGVYVGDEDLTSNEAIIKAGLDWTVSPRQLYLAGEIPVKDQYAICRDTDNSVYGIVKDQYKPVQNAEAFAFMDCIVGNGEARFHTAGSLSGGSRVWALAKVGTMEIVNNDPIDQYLFLYNSHDGKSSLRCFMTEVRVVCANTAAVAMKKGSGEGITIRHFSSIDRKLEEAKSILGFAQENFNAQKEFLTAIQRLSFTSFSAKELIKKLFAEKEEKGKRDRVTSKISKIENLFHHGVGQELAGVRGTGLALYNAAVEYQNYFSEVRGTGTKAAESRFASSILKPTVVNNMIQLLKAA